MKKLLIGIVCLIMLIVIGGCGTEKKQSEESVLKVGTNATFVPFEFTSEGKELTGFDIELIQAIAKEIGKTPEYHNVAFDGLIPAINTGQIDVAISGMTITEDRQEKIDFSIPYYQSGLGILVPTDSFVNSIADLKGKKIAVQMGTTGADKANEIEGAELRTFDHNSEALLELKKGGVDAVISDLPVLQYYLSTSGSNTAKLIPVQGDVPEYFGIAIKKGNSVIKNEVDVAIKKLKENGKLNELYNKYFHQNAPQMPE